MSKSIPSPTTVSGRTESGRPEPSARQQAELDDWMHEFRNALGNVTIAASAASAEFADHPSQQASSLMRQIEEGCDRCLRLLKTMPR
ncbi:MAG TPA: hypothetical protein VK753_13540 [Xanthomonadaceae bacterium]|jgi:hypothetical protein|nr:hypothetical protein [Xanthomonadaceae bacterium]